MALTRKQWNNIIILACIFIIAVLTFMDKKTHNVPSDAQLLFDDNAPLAQLQLDGVWLHKQASGWECDPLVLNCTQWVKAWQGLRVSPLSDTPQPTGKPQELVIQIAEIRQSQRWIYFPEDGVLKSPAGNWYLVPPSLRADLQPILDAKSTS
ncbi:hypothetical protein CF168_20620 [Shewanella bicestrii]|uniref:Uncharacterized protein n=1 Tax=Shewanella bicestrii TaxID=2018305 RepID=A0A220USX0_9GAMM|nr:hypothetical protein [Shewanella bicestrii]ASK71090.1 hypothetical protein CF168_20620 [Shewanella bicestrii]